MRKSSTNRGFTGEIMYELIYILIWGFPLPRLNTEGIPEWCLRHGMYS